MLGEGYGRVVCEAGPCPIQHRWGEIKPDRLTRGSAFAANRNESTVAGPAIQYAARVGRDQLPENILVRADHGGRVRQGLIQITEDMLFVAPLSSAGCRRAGVIRLRSGQLAT